MKRSTSLCTGAVIQQQMLSAMIIYSFQIPEEKFKIKFNITEKYSGLLISLRMFLYGHVLSTF